jgi:hypothetical protein
MNLLDLVKTLVPRMKNADSELTAYKMTLETFKQNAPQYAGFLDSVLATSRLSPSLGGLMHKKWDEPLEQFLQQESESPTLEAVLELFNKISEDDLLS